MRQSLICPLDEYESMYGCKSFFFFLSPHWHNHSLWVWHKEKKKERLFHCQRQRPTPRRQMGLSSTSSTFFRLMLFRRTATLCSDTSDLNNTPTNTSFILSWTYWPSGLDNTDHSLLPVRKKNLLSDFSPVWEFAVCWYKISLVTRNINTERKCFWW